MRTTPISPLEVKQKSFLLYIIFGLGLFAALRFSTGGLFAYSCAVTYLIAIIFVIKNEKDKSINILLLSLFFVSDYGAPYYDETIPLIKYIIIFTILTLFLVEAKYKITYRSCILILILLLNLSFSTFLQYEYELFNFDVFKRDIQILFLIILGLCTYVRYANDFRILLIGVLGYFSGEVLNYFFFHHDINEYMNYSSLKTLVFLPLIIYFGQKGNIFIKVSLLFLSMLILSEYGTRLIIVTWMIWFITWVFTKSFIYPSKRAMKKIILILFLLIGFSITIGVYLPEETSSKTLNILLLVSSLINGGFLILQELVPVRYAEHELFFSRPFYQLLFGSGLGSGIFDSKDVLYFVAPNTGAFSLAELNNNIFFNFHDIWIDFTLRFGLVPIIYLYYQFTLKKISNGEVITSSILTVIAFCSTFSSSGLLLLFILTKKFNFDLHKSVDSKKPQLKI